MWNTSKIIIQEFIHEDVIVKIKFFRNSNKET